MEAWRARGVHQSVRRSHDRLQPDPDRSVNRPSARRCAPSPGNRQYRITFKSLRRKDRRSGRVRARAPEGERQMNGRMRAWFLAGACALCAAGCESDHVVYVSETNLGITVNAASQGTPKVALGYDRETFAVVPRYESDVNGPEAMSLLSLSNVDVTGL